MKTLIVTSAVFAFAGAFGPAGPASAAPAHETVVVAHFDDGDHGHNDVDLDNDDPVTDQGPNKGTEPLKNSEQLADGGGED